VIEPGRARTLAELFRDSLALWAARWPAFLAIGAVVVAPVYLAIFGIGLGELTARYDDHQSQGRIFLEGGVIVGVVVPLMTVMVARLVCTPSLSARAAIEAGLERYVPALLVMVVVIASAIAGLFVFIVPGIYLGVRLAFAVPSLAVEDVRGLDAVRRSWALTAPDFWRPLGLLIAIYAATAIAGQILLQLFVLLAQATDSQGVALGGDIVADALTLPPGLIAVTLLTLDLRARHAGD
jgi:hypothetical protein